MELKSRTESMFLRFATGGSLGRGATRETLSDEDRAEAAALPLGMDMVGSYDNGPIDLDPRPGYVRFTRAALDGQMAADADLPLEGPPAPGEASGQVSNTNGILQGWLETQGEASDVDFIVSGPNGFSYLHVQPTEQGFFARGMRVDAEHSVSYQETLSGSWNLLR